MPAYDSQVEFNFKSGGGKFVFSKQNDRKIMFTIDICNMYV